MAGGTTIFTTADGRDTTVSWAGDDDTDDMMMMIILMMSRLDKIREKVTDKISTMTCILRQMGVIDSEGRVDYMAVEHQVGSWG